MILLAPVDGDKIELDRSIFLSLLMSETISKEVLSGNLKFSNPLLPVHLPFKMLHKPYFGSGDHLTADLNDWKAGNFPMQYNGEKLNGKKIIVFPMHGLGDQLYLATALKNLSDRYHELEITIVKSGLHSAEQWYDYIYFYKNFKLTGPVVTASEIAEFDYFVNAEHFSHLDDYKRAYPSKFYYERMLHHDSAELKDLTPAIKEFTTVKKVRDVFDTLKRTGLPSLFINPVTTGRVRDIPNTTIIDFVNLVKDRCNVIVSVFKNPSLNLEIQKLSIGNVISSDGLINSSEDLLSVVSLSDLILTSDSGITHLAEALKKPCGSVFNVVTSKERVEFYKFSEELDVVFEIEGVCKTPCYVHALPEDMECPGMAHFNKIHGAKLFYEYPPCMQNLSAEHLYALFDLVYKKI